MELGEILNPWIQQMETAFQPYPAFVDEVTQKLTELDQVQQALLGALRDAFSEITRLENVAQANTHDTQTTGPHDSMSDSDRDAEAQSKLSELRSEIESLKRLLQEKAVDLQSKNVQLEAQRVQFEEQLAIRQSQQAKLDEYQHHTKSSDSSVQELRAQVDTLKIALAEAKASIAANVSHVRSEETQSRTPQAPRQSQPKMLALPGRSVLLVDDAEINRVLMSHYFKGLPVKLEFAISISAAIQKCKDHKFDLIVIDDELQGLENTELTQSSQKLVALSNRNEASATMRPEFQHVISRGLNRESFVEQLKSFLWTA